MLRETIEVKSKLDVGKSRVSREIFEVRDKLPEPTADETEPEELDEDEPEELDEATENYIFIIESRLLAYHYGPTNVTEVWTVFYGALLKFISFGALFQFIASVLNVL